jgi:ATP phosphoribosyltransferase regulatory subunit
VGTERVKIGIPVGHRDLLFDEAAWIRKTDSAMAAVFSSAGYREVIPSAVEFYALYERGHQSARQRALRFLDRDDRLVALRADFTPAVARMVAGPLAEIPLPLRVWYAGTVFRKTENLRGAFRETVQVGAELIGDGTSESDAGILGLMLRCLEAAGAGKVSLHLNHAGIFRGILRELNLQAGAVEGLQAEIDRKDVRGLAEKLTSLGIPQEMQRQVQGLARCIGPAPVLDEAYALVTNAESRSGILSLGNLARRLELENVSVTFDLAEMDDLEYYTGIMFTAFLPAQNREVCKGGRYDSLLAEFGREAPAIGFSISLDALKEVP